MNRLFRIIKTVSLNRFHMNGIDIVGFPNYGKKVEIYTRGHGRIIIKKDASISSYVHITSINGLMEIGEKVFINRGCIFVCRESINIGDGCIFGPNVCIYDHDHEYDWHGIKHDYKKAGIVIEDGCWIGANVTILRGTHIGERCVIGAGTVVKGNIPAHSIVMNNRELKTIAIKK